ncbi:hypothetical protein ACROYT_G033727 [Oculina patagonica]
MLVQTMENNEEMLQALHEFENMTNSEKVLTQELEDMLSYIAKTGRVLFPWDSLKPVFLFKLDKVMREFFESSPSRNASSSEPTVTADFEVMRQRLLDCLDSFTSAPFTIQRLCELMMEPRKNYSNSEKFMRGVEKNVLVVSTVELGRDDIAVFNLTNNIDGQHMLSNVPNGPVTNGVMTLAVTSEGDSVTDHGYDERLSPHVTPEGVTSSVTPDTNGPTPLNAYENGHGNQEHYNGGSSPALGAATEEKSSAPDAAPLSKQELSEENMLTNKEEEHEQLEEAPERENTDGVPADNASEIPAEEKEATNSSREEVEQVPAADEATDSVEQQTTDTSKILETSETCQEEEEPMDEN